MLHTDMNKIHVVCPSAYPEGSILLHTAYTLAAVQPRLILVVIVLNVSNQLKAAVKLKPVPSNIHNIYSVSQLRLTLTWEVAQSANRGSVESAIIIFSIVYNHPYRGVVFHRVHHVAQTHRTLGLECKNPAAAFILKTHLKLSTLSHRKVCSAREAQHVDLLVIHSESSSIIQTQPSTQVNQRASHLFCRKQRCSPPPRGGLSPPPRCVPFLSALRPKVHFHRREVKACFYTRSTSAQCRGSAG